MQDASATSRLSLLNNCFVVFARPLITSSTNASDLEADDFRVAFLRYSKCRHWCCRKSYAGVMRTYY